MNTAAPHALKKRLLTLALSLAFLLTCLPAALAVDLNVDAGFYFKQSRGGTCTLASAAMMLRRRAYFDGLSDWTNVTLHRIALRSKKIKPKTTRTALIIHIKTPTGRVGNSVDRMTDTPEVPPKAK